MTNISTYNYGLSLRVDQGDSLQVVDRLQRALEDLSRTVNQMFEAPQRAFENIKASPKHPMLHDMDAQRRVNVDMPGLSPENEARLLESQRLRIEGNIAAVRAQEAVARERREHEFDQARLRSQKTIATIRGQQDAALYLQQQRAETEAIAKRLNGIRTISSAEAEASRERHRLMMQSFHGTAGGVGGPVDPRRGGRWTPIVTEFGRGAEDFAIQFGAAKDNVEGLRMGLRGAANNMAQMASLMHPVAGAVVGISAALAATIVPAMLDWVYNTEAVKKAAKDMERDYDRLADRLRDVANIKAGTAAKTISDLEEELAANAAVSAELVKRRTEAQRDVSKSTRFLEMGSDERGRAIDTRFIRGEIERNKLIVAETDKRLKEISDKEIDSRTRVNMLRGRADREAAEEELRNREKFLAERDRMEAEAIKANRDKLMEIQKSAQRELDKDMPLEVKHARERQEIEAMFPNQADRVRRDTVRLVTARQSQEIAKRDHDAEIKSREKRLDAIRREIDRVGKTPGSGAAAISGTQMAEQIISRAVAGTKTTEGTLNKMLKVEEQQLAEMKRNGVPKVAVP